MQPRRSLYVYKNLSLDHNLNQVPVVYTLTPCFTIQVVCSPAYISHFPIHVQYITILNHLNFITIVIFDEAYLQIFKLLIIKSLPPSVHIFSSSACSQTPSVRILPLG
jgi:hypothetical protein